MKKLTWHVVVGVLAMATLATPTRAHTGTGQAFVKVNGEYVKANPIAGISPTLPADLAPSNYAAGKPVELSVDRSLFGRPENQFRWQWSKNETALEEGDKAVHTYESPGTYVVTLQLKSDPGGSFSDLNTIGLNIVPGTGSAPPNPKVEVTHKGSSGDSYTVGFEVKRDEAAGELVEYSWQFGDGTSGEGRVVEHTYKGLDFDVYPWLHVKDKNNLTSDVAFELFAEGNRLKVGDIPEMPGVASLSGKTGGRGFSKGLIVVAGAGLLGLVILWSVRKRRTSRG